MQGFCEYRGPFSGEAPQLDDLQPPSPGCSLIHPNNRSKRTWPRLLRKALTVLLNSRNPNLQKPLASRRASKLIMEEGMAMQRLRVSSSRLLYTRTKDDGLVWDGRIIP